MKKDKTLKRFLAFLLSAAMLVTYMPSPVYALEGDGTDTPEVAADSGGSGDEAAKESSKKAAPEAAPGRERHRVYPAEL